MTTTEGDFATVHPAWNVWALYQVKDLSDTNPLWWGVSRDRRLTIWVEDQLRAHGVDVADPLDLKGSQIEILPSVPADLVAEKRKESIGGSEALNLPAASDLRAVRFYNRGGPVNLPWPHDDEYLLDAVFAPSSTSPATSGPPPGKVSDAVTEPASTIGKTVALLAVGVGALWVLSKFSD